MFLHLNSLKLSTVYRLNYLFVFMFALIKMHCFDFEDDTFFGELIQLRAYFQLSIFLWSLIEIFK